MVTQLRGSILILMVLAFMLLATLSPVALFAAHPKGSPPQTACPKPGKGPPPGHNPHGCPPGHGY
jgi:hypothetical protein